MRHLISFSAPSLVQLILVLFQFRWTIELLYRKSTLQLSIMLWRGPSIWIDLHFVDFLRIHGPIPSVHPFSIHFLSSSVFSSIKNHFYRKNKGIKITNNFCIKVLNVKGIYWKKWWRDFTQRWHDNELKIVQKQALPLSCYINLPIVNSRGHSLQNWSTGNMKKSCFLLRMKWIDSIDAKNRFVSQFLIQEIKKRYISVDCVFGCITCVSSQDKMTFPSCTQFTIDNLFTIN
jgi:hypothetical protein